jgi:hypothetical protein
MDTDLNPWNAAAGLAGALVLVTNRAAETPRKTIGLLLAGCGSGAYLTPVVADLLGNKIPQGAIGFVLGVSAMSGIQLLINKIMPKDERPN